MSTSTKSWIDGAILKQAFIDSLVKLDPRKLWENPVMFVTAVGALLSTGVVLLDAASAVFSGFVIQITALALVHGPLCQFRGSHGGGARQGAGGFASCRTDPDFRTSP